MMKISPETLSIFKNFSSINPSLQINPGDKIRTICPGHSILAEAIVDESFPKACTIYDLNRFLGVHSCLEDPEFTFGDNALKLTDKNRSVNYVYADPSTITSPGTDESIDAFETNIKFKLNQGDFKQIMKMSSILQAPHLSIIGEGGKLKLVVSDIEDSAKGDFDIDLNESTKDTFNAIIKIENLKLLAGSYEVSLSSMLLSHFKSVSTNLQYWVAVEDESKFE